MTEAKRYRLHDGTCGSEYEAVLEVVQALEAQQEAIATRLATARSRLERADGHFNPGDPAHCDRCFKEAERRRTERSD